MREISELIYETCKTYLVTQGKFILFAVGVHRVIIVLYFGWLRRCRISRSRHAADHPCSSAWSASPAATAWRGSASASTPSPTRARLSPACAASRIPIYQIPLEAGMSIGMMLISVELLIMLFILLFIPGDYAGPCFIGFAIGESLGAAALRIAGGIFTKIADIGSDLMKIVFKIKEDDARNPGVIADCTGDNAGDSVGPSADGFETYGVTGVALITFILLGVNETRRCRCSCWSGSSSCAS
jgi:K(+)-stimulated pyrophosphate-energized sodium pump